MSSVQILSSDGSVLIPAAGITALDVVGTTLVAQVPSLGGPIVLAEGTPHELSGAAHSLISGIADLGEGDWTIRAARSSTGVIWHGTAVPPDADPDADPAADPAAGPAEESAGASWGSLSTGYSSKLTLSWPDHPDA